MTKLTNEQVEVNENAMYTLKSVMAMNEEDAQALIGHTPNEVRQALVLLQIQVEKMEVDLLMERKEVQCWKDTYTEMKTELEKKVKERTETGNVAFCAMKRQARLKHQAQKALAKLQGELVDGDTVAVEFNGKKVVFESVDVRG